AQTPTAATPIAASPMAAVKPISWTELGPGGVLLARAIAAAACPAIAIDGAAAPMTVHAPATAAFPDVVCQATIPAAAKSAAIGAQALALLPASYDRIAVVGDTGCRVVQSRAQPCDDPAAWPLAQVAGQIAGWQPGLIIHVGDYIYREAPCPAGDAGCAGSPWGDNAATWQADVFRPMASVLPAAPWIFVRGNHEDCDREGFGWFRYFDPRPLPSACETYTDPYPIPLNGVRFLVMDTAEAGDTQSSPALDAVYAAQLKQLAALTKPGDWLLTHKPIAGGILRLNGKPEQIVTDKTFQNISGSRLPAGIAVVLSGHIHLAEALLFNNDSGRPTQLISGNGGTLEDPGRTGAFAGAILGDPNVQVGFVGADFGWMTLVTDGDRLTATARALDGSAQFTVHLPAR
ncbi:MAG TPA: metallophosphoesterase, partial [Thermomicrobiales bacterium]|nr:metallophosphoesterase [Thermomicrobiales bacterium]